MLKEYFNTLIFTLKKPFDVIESSIKSASSDYQHPFKFNFIGVLALVFIFLLLPDFTVNPAQPAENETALQLQQSILDVKVEAATHFLPLSMFLLLIISLSIPGLFFFRNQLHGFYSNLILNSLAVGAALPFTLLLVPFWYFAGLSPTHVFLSSYLPGAVLAGVILRVYSGYLSSDDAITWIRMISSFILGFFIFLALRDFGAAVLGYFLFALERLIDVWQHPPA
ncbi:MAG: hypothetical protein GVY02_01595 [Bacteroidetes bacterium]|jgi:hypothetical protein|nr:hypothetical protein [Bacteroidota bacterium]